MTHTENLKGQTVTLTFAGSLPLATLKRRGVITQDEAHPEAPGADILIMRQTHVCIDGRWYRKPMSGVKVNRRAITDTRIH